LCGLFPRSVLSALYGLFVAGVKDTFVVSFPSAEPMVNNLFPPQVPAVFQHTNPSCALARTTFSHVTKAFGTAALGVISYSISVSTANGELTVGTPHSPRPPQVDTSPQSGTACCVHATDLYNHPSSC
jgi:hypothetical protein